ncbi:aspartyl-phosphate phosphatase Spo0E family protein [Paenibacillus tyrfis]|uniref:aspartyl-phosphate phosphatase Spo0E family protein n=1 Tax=Paenibacillus tyrfis TaxID=1501230 RepID=UPI0028157C3A|nr:aspartyl-phosphate phosphatase Spo0E family protein [Paenibacillus tyrfis]
MFFLSKKRKPLIWINSIIIGFEGCFMNRRLTQKIKKLQQQLILLVEQKGSFTDQEVIKLSQCLDQYILIAQKSSSKLKVCG